MLKYSQLCLALVLIGSCQMFAQDGSEKYALLIGIDKYRHSVLNGDEPLKYAAADVTELAELLRNSGYEVDLLIGSQATKAAIDGKLPELTRKGNADGVV